ncbi:MAG: FAD-dependent monooxygenase [Hellea sp.]
MAQTKPQPQIVIIGAGIAGLALAHGLHKLGFETTLVEQSDELSEIGSGISIWENGLQALATIGLREAVESRGLAWPNYEIHRPKKSIIVRDNTILSLGGMTAPLMLKRGALFGELRDALPTSINIITGFKVQSISEGSLIATDGRRLTGDLIIGADGSHSIVRQQLTSQMPKFRKQICFRGIASNVTGKGWNPAEVYDDRRHRFGYFRLPDNQVYWFDIVDSETPYDEFSAHRRDIENLSPFIASLIEKTPAETILCHPIEDMPPVTTWHRAIALIGDAAHPMQPSLGQGACLALEDSVVLADSLGQERQDFGKAIQTYLSLRKKRWKSYYSLCDQLGTGALDKGVWGRKLALMRMVHTPEWSLSLFGRHIFAFKQRNISF